MTVTVYTREGCMQCKATIRMFQSKGVDPHIVDITDNDSARDRLVEQGYTQLPVVTCDGGEWSGYRPDLILAATQKAQ